MSEEINILFASHTYQTSMNRQFSILSSSAQKLRCKLDAETRNNRLKDQEIKALKHKVMSLEEGQVTLDKEHEDERKDLQSTLEMQRRIKSDLFGQISAIKKERNDISSKHKMQIQQIHKNHDSRKQAQLQTVFALLHQKTSLNERLQGMTQSNDRLNVKTQDLVEKLERLSSENVMNEMKMMNKMNVMNVERLRHLSTVERLQCRCQRLQTAADHLDEKPLDGEEAKDNDEELEALSIDLKSKLNKALMAKSKIIEKVEALEVVRDSLLNENYVLLREEDALKKKLNDALFALSANNRESEMKRNQFHHEIARKNELISRLEQNQEIAKEAMAAKRGCHQKQVLRLKEEMKEYVEANRDRLHQTLGSLSIAHSNSAPNVAPLFTESEDEDALNAKVTQDTVEEIWDDEDADDDDPCSFHFDEEDEDGPFIVDDTIDSISIISNLNPNPIQNEEHKMNLKQMLEEEAQTMSLQYDYKAHLVSPQITPYITDSTNSEDELYQMLDGEQTHYREPHGSNSFSNVSVVSSHDMSSKQM